MQVNADEKEKAKKEQGERPLRNAIWSVIAYFVTIAVILTLFYFCLNFFRVQFGFTDLIWNVDAVTRVAIGVFAIFVFVITIWRGNLHSAQVRNQTMQLEISNRQIDVANKQRRIAAKNLKETQNNNLAKLLVDGTKLLADETTDAEKIAGVACLSYITKGNLVFGGQAASVLKAFIDRVAQKHPNGVEIDTNQSFAMALDAIEKYCQISREQTSIHRIMIIGSSQERTSRFWPNIKDIIYKNFAFQNVVFDKKAARCTTINCMFTHCTFTDYDWLQLANIGKANEKNLQILTCDDDNIEPRDRMQPMFKNCVFNSINPPKELVENPFFGKQFFNLFESCYYDPERIINPDQQAIFNALGICPINEQVGDATAIAMQTIS